MSAVAKTDREIMRGLFAKGYGHEDAFVAMTAHLRLNGENKRQYRDYVRSVWREFHFPAATRQHEQAGV